MIKHRKKRNYFLILALILLFVLAAGFFIYLKKGPYRAAMNIPPRSVRLNTYNTWHMVHSVDRDNHAKLQEALEIYAKHDIAVWSESTEQVNSVPGWGKLTTASLKALNPNIKTYAYYEGGGKSVSEGDWEKPENLFDSSMTMMNPVPWHVINANDWWLRDGEEAHNIVKNSYDNYNVWYLDIGKSGYKELYASALIDRLKSRGFEGVTLDYLPMSIGDGFFAEPGGYFNPNNPNSHPMPTDYATDEDWYSDAYKPFVEYVFAALDTAGYEVVGGGLPYYGASEKQRFTRERIDAQTYEFWAVNADADWFSPETIVSRMNDFQNDPLDIWLSDFMLRNTTNDYERKYTVGLGMYYIAQPPNNNSRSYHHYGDMYAFWLPLWDFNIGAPEALAVKSADKYFWSRKYSDGLVLLNYDSASVVYNLSGNYVDSKGTKYSGTVNVGEHTALILKIDATRGRTPLPSTDPQSSPAETPNQGVLIDPITGMVLSPTSSLKPSGSTSPSPAVSTLPSSLASPGTPVGVESSPAVIIGKTKGFIIANGATIVFVLVIIFLIVATVLTLFRKQIAKKIKDSSKDEVSIR